MTGYSHTNREELRAFTRKQRQQAGRALWNGRQAFMNGDEWDANPYGGWNKLDNGQHTFQCLLWCRWLHGWLTEFYRKRDASSGESQ